MSSIRPEQLGASPLFQRRAIALSAVLAMLALGGAFALVTVDAPRTPNPGSQSSQPVATAAPKLTWKKSLRRRSLKRWFVKHQALTTCPERASWQQSPTEPAPRPNTLRRADPAYAPDPPRTSSPRRSRYSRATDERPFQRAPAAGVRRAISTRTTHGRNENHHGPLREPRQLCSWRLRSRSAPLRRARSRPTPEPGSEQLREARTRFQRGIELYEEGDMDAALVELRRAYELAPSYKLLFNIGQVQLQKSDYASALDSFERYLAQGGDNISRKRRGELEPLVQKLRQRVAEVTVTVDVAGAEVLVDDLPRGTAPLARAARRQRRTPQDFRASSGPRTPR